MSSCLVNPKVCHETLYEETKVEKAKKIAVVGAGPAGLAFSYTASKRGHKVTLFEQDSSIGGQFNMAKNTWQRRVSRNPSLLWGHVEEMGSRP